MVHCISCQKPTSESGPYLYKSDYFRTNFPDLRIYACDACGLLHVDHDLIADEKLSNYYRSIYRQEARIHVFEEFSPYLQARGNALAALAKTHSGDLEVRKIFELGSGHGYALKALAETYPSAQLFTDELDENAHVEASRAAIHDGPYDIVLLSHVLEHLVRPKTFISDACNNLAQGGLLVIEVPFESRQFVFQFNADEGRFHEPHITFFSKRSLENFFRLNFDGELDVVFSGSAGPLIEERDRMINRQLSPPLPDRIYKALAFAPSVRRVLQRLYRLLTRQQTNPVATTHESLIDNSPDDTRVFLRIVLRRRPA